MATPPSRHSNPFATCWTSPQVMKYIAADDATPCDLVERLCGCEWQGQITGPHGVGKSTLLTAMRPHAEAAGRAWRQVNLYSYSARIRWRDLPIAPEELLVVDGFEQLGRFTRGWVRWRCAAVGAGLLVTTHRAMPLPMLVELRPNLRTAQLVYEQLITDRETNVKIDDLVDAFNACGGNIRETLFYLYDLHEQRDRTPRVANKPRTKRVRPAKPRAAFD